MSEMVFGDGKTKGGKAEVMLLRWAETSNNGATIVLQLADVADLEPFKMMTLAKGKIAGQRLQIVYVEIGDDERPKAQPDAKGGPLSILAARWCKDAEFQGWVAEAFKMNSSFDVSLNPEEMAATVVRGVCGITSRRDIDKYGSAENLFDNIIRRPYMKYLQQLRERGDAN